MEKGLNGKYFANEKEVKTAKMKWFKKQSTKFYKAGIQTLIRRWNTAVERNGDYVESWDGIYR